MTIRDKRALFHRYFKKKGYRRNGDTYIDSSDSGNMVYTLNEEWSLKFKSDHFVVSFTDIFDRVWVGFIKEGYNSYELVAKCINSRVFRIFTKDVTMDIDKLKEDKAEILLFLEGFLFQNKYRLQLLSGKLKIAANHNDERVIFELLKAIKMSQYMTLKKRPI